MAAIIICLTFLCYNLLKDFKKIEGDEMAYIALYRKWRPMVFEEVVGQSYITTTIKNQIKNNNVAHAYLFSGTRGTGKTSTAKIFARAINCLNPKDSNPCNECEICKGILNESLMDVIEIDAASNNGVDNIRELRENVKYPPSKGKYKVYIIDEVHMLSQGAFNALLKTLEEPPSYAVFILATTEPHKLPVTILSRCQRYDFKRVSYQEIYDRLEYICKSTGVKVEDKALRLIVSNSDGAVRDALSILDQCLSFCENELTYDKAIETLGFVTDEFLFRLTDNIYERNSIECIKIIDDLINSGKDVAHFIKNLILHFRNLLITKMSDSSQEIINMSQESIARLKEQSSKFDNHTLIRYLNILSQGENEIKWANNPRILLELVIVKLIQPRFEDSYEALLDRISLLEKKIKDLEEKGVKVIEKKTPDNSQNNANNIKEKETDIFQGDSEITEVSDNTSNTDTETNNEPSFDEIKNKWNEVLKEVKRQKISTHAVLMEGRLITLEGRKLIIGFKEGFWFHKENTSKESNSQLIEKAILDITDQRVKLKCVMEDEYQHLIDIPKDEITATEEVNEEIKQIKEFFSEFQDKLEILE